MLNLIQKLFKKCVGYGLFFKYHTYEGVFLIFDMYTIIIFIIIIMYAFVIIVMIMHIVVYELHIWKYVCVILLVFFKHYVNNVIL